MSDNIGKIERHTQNECFIKSNNQELCDLEKIMKMERWKYFQNKILCESVFKCLNEENCMSDCLKKKVYNILLSSDINSCTNISSDHSELKLLGLIEMGSPKLSYDEQKKLSECVETKLIEMNKDMTKCLDKLNYVNIKGSSNLLSLSTEDKVLIDFKKKLLAAQKQYVENLLNHYSLLEQILELRLQTLKSVTEQKIEDCIIKTKMYNLRSQIIREKARVDIFSETNTSVIAYKELINDILESQDQCHQDIDQLEVLKESYKQVSCKQYDEILHLYLQYKNAIAKKNFLSKQIKNK